MVLVSVLSKVTRRPESATGYENGARSNRLSALRVRQVGPTVLDFLYFNHTRMRLF